MLDLITVPEYADYSIPKVKSVECDYEKCGVDLGVAYHFPVLGVGIDWDLPKRKDKLTL